MKKQKRKAVARPVETDAGVEDSPERYSTIKLVQRDTDKVLGTIDVKDKRLERVLYDIFQGYPAFVWDAKHGSFHVNLEAYTPKHHPDRLREVTASEKLADRISKEIAQSRPVSDLLGHGLTVNPKWTGKGTGTYTSRLGWTLTRDPTHRGKHWRLTHDKSTREVWVRNKKEATAMILDQSAAKALFG